AVFQLHNQRRLAGDGLAGDGERVPQRQVISVEAEFHSRFIPSRGTACNSPRSSPTTARVPSGEIASDISQPSPTFLSRTVSSDCQSMTRKRPSVHATAT